MQIAEPKKYRMTGNRATEVPYEPIRKIRHDDEFIRDCWATIGRPATFSMQAQAISICDFEYATLITSGPEIALLVDSDRDRVEGHIGEHRIDDSRADHGPAWLALMGLLDRQD